MPEYCDFLQGVCELQTLVSAHLLLNDFFDPELRELIKNSGDIKVIPYNAQADETAKVLVIMQRGDIVLTPKQSLNYSSRESSYQPALTVSFTISSQSYYITEKLGAELLQYIASISNAIKERNINIGGLSLSPTTNNKEVSPNYFINTLSVNCTIPRTMWKIQTSDDILSTLRLNVKFDGQNILFK